jgi:hypothetical protein
MPGPVLPTELARIRPRMRSFFGAFAIFVAETRETPGEFAVPRQS